MNAVEIEEAVSALAEQPFDAADFPYAFLAAFGNKDATLRRLRSTKSSEKTNKSDVGGVLQRNNIHLAVSSASPSFSGQRLVTHSPRISTDGSVVTSAAAAAAGAVGTSGWGVLVLPPQLARLRTEMFAR